MPRVKHTLWCPQRTWRARCLDMCFSCTSLLQCLACCCSEMRVLSQRAWWAQHVHLSMCVGIRNGERVCVCVCVCVCMRVRVWPCVCMCVPLVHTRPRFPFCIGRLSRAWQNAFRRGVAWHITPITHASCLHAFPRKAAQAPLFARARRHMLCEEQSRSATLENLPQLLPLFHEPAAPFSPFFVVWFMVPSINMCAWKYVTFCTHGTQNDPWDVKWLVQNKSHFMYTNTRMWMSTQEQRKKKSYVPGLRFGRSIEPAKRLGFPLPRVF